MVNIDSAILPAIGLVSVTIQEFNAFPFSPGFDVRKVSAQAESLPSHSWEFGTTMQALLELYNPELSIFGAKPFPLPEGVQKTTVRGLDYVASKVRFGTGYAALDQGNGAAGDPASMGVGAIMLGKTNKTFADAAKATADGLLRDIPRFSNGAISHRANVPELWADFMYMVPPFLAYYAADNEDEKLLQDTVTQCRLYREILQGNSKGAWRHIIGPQSQDTGLWSTGNAWAAGGMARVLATISKSSFITNLTWRQKAIDDLTDYIQEIIDGAMASQMDHGLLRNYFDDLNSASHGFGEISGSSMLAATVYRMAVLQPKVFGSKYIRWADGLRATLSGNDANGKPHITSTGIVTPAVNPLAWKDIKPFTSGSPEGNAMVVLMYAGWRDCVKSGYCTSSPGGSGESLIADNAVEKHIEHREAKPLHMHGGMRRHFSHLIHGSVN